MNSQMFFAGEYVLSDLMVVYDQQMIHPKWKIFGFTLLDI